jgi:hypothetical protein
MNPAKPKQTNKQEKLVEGVDYYFENGLMVLTAHFLLKRGYCCGNDCRHCPYPKDDESNLK